MLTSDVLKLGSNLDVLKTYPDNYFSAVVTDPPYALTFMGREWDTFSDSESFQTFTKQWAIEVFRVLKPGGHVLAFGGTRTWHRLACAIEDAGFEIRDTIAWMYGSGFPKSFNISKAFDKKAGATRKVVGKGATPQGAGWVAQNQAGFKPDYDLTLPESPDAIAWDGWGTALKPAFEPIVVARKPLIGSITDNIEAHGTGGINIDDSRVGPKDPDAKVVNRNAGRDEPNYLNRVYGRGFGGMDWDSSKGRFPSNVLLGHHHSCTEIVKRQKQLFEWGTQLEPTLEVMCHTDCPIRQVDDQSGELSSTLRTVKDYEHRPGFLKHLDQGLGYSDGGGASRFFYQAKPDNKERYFWCPVCKQFSNDHEGHESHRASLVMHPTQKPIQLMRYLIRMVTPPGGVVLDPFVGSGTTCVAAKLEGFASVGIEMEFMSHAIARYRYRWAGEEQQSSIPLEGLDS